MDETKEKNLRRVAWVNVWTASAALHHDVPGLVHLTESAGRTGKTLCGREFPKEKGYPSAVRYCKRCVAKAYHWGFQPGFTKKLGAVP